jgi:hypothetical protein
MPSSGNLWTLMLELPPDERPSLRLEILGNGVTGVDTEARARLDAAMLAAPGLVTATIRSGRSHG